MGFIKISEKEFTLWAENFFDDIDYLYPRYGKELVIVAKDFFEGLEVHIYTSITMGETRDNGEDAIRCVLYDPESLIAIESATRVNRVGSENSSVFERIEERLAGLLSTAKGLVYCDSCGAHKIKRTNNTTSRSFYGCSAFPKCGRNQPIKRKYPLIEIDNEIQTEDHYDNKISDSGQKPPILTTLVDDLVPTTEYPYQSYPFEYFNKVQSTLYRNISYDNDVNLIMGTTTSSGKTICAELFMGHTLYEQKKKVVYVSPLKSLTEEKFDEWVKTYPDKKIVKMTGDYQLKSKKRIEEVNEADILCMTSEMLDSRTRNQQSEKSNWIKKVGLIILDESHIISIEGRGHAVEVGLMRFCKINPSARILFLSATMPNVDDFKAWLESLNSKPTEIINSDWRATTLDWHFIEYEESFYKKEQNEKMILALDIIKNKPNEKFLVFVHDKNSGREFVKRLGYQKIDSRFHNADLSLNDKMDIERSFADKKEGLRVLVSTSTLAWGRSLPARNVVILGVTRGMNEVDEIDIIQMGGRAGRFGIDVKGDCFLICEDSAKWRHTIRNPRLVISTLLNKDILGFHILAGINLEDITNRETLIKWYEQTLAYLQCEIDDSMLDDVLSNLVDMEMIKVRGEGEEEYYQLTRLGTISARMYYTPRDIFNWKEMFKYVAKEDSWESDLDISFAVASAPSYHLGYVPKNFIAEVDKYANRIKYGNTFPNDKVLRMWQDVFFTETNCVGDVYRSVNAAHLHEWINKGKDSMLIKSINHDAERICEALSYIFSIYNWCPDKNVLKTLPLRMKYGITKDLVSFCKLPSVGKVRAEKLYEEGFRNWSDILNKPHKVRDLLGIEVGGKIIKYLRSKKQ